MAEGNFRPIGSRTRNWQQAAATVPSTTLVWMRASPSRSGAGKAGFIPMTRGVGSNGIADIIWAGDCPRRMIVKSSVGKPCDATSGKFYVTACRAIRLDAGASVKPCYIGPMTAVNCRTVRHAPELLAMNVAAARVPLAPDEYTSRQG